MEKEKIGIDIETYSDEDIKFGVHKYVSSPVFEIMLFAFSYSNSKEVICIDLAQGETIPKEILKDLSNKNIIKTAFNAGFEITCLNKVFNNITDVSQWQCTAAHARYLNLPGALKNVAPIFNLQKIEAGKNLISYFCKPCRPTKVNGGRTRNLPNHAVEKWSAFKEYNINDVIVEQYLNTEFQKYPMPNREQKLYQIDYNLNNKGIKLDMDLVHKAVQLDELRKERLINKGKNLGITNPNSLPQLKQYIANKNQVISDMSAPTVKALIAREDISSDIKDVLKIRQGLSNTSIKKFQKMLKVNIDGYVYDCVMYYGASTGRDAGRIIQFQNLPRGDKKRVVIDRENLKLFINLDEIDLKNLIRPAIIAPNDGYMAVSDFSAIECRVLAWLSDEQWVIDAFVNGKDVYKKTYQQMYDVDMDSIGDDERFIGKVCTLACGYQGGKKAVQNFAPDFTDDEAEVIKRDWRLANPNIVNIWYRAQELAIETIKTGRSHELAKGVIFQKYRAYLRVKLPFGRHLYYLSPKLQPGTYGDEITFLEWSTNAMLRKNTYGGKLIENIVQAIARDILADKTFMLSRLGYNIGLRVHDEFVIWLDKNVDKEKTINSIDKIMGRECQWAKGLPLAGVTEILKYYKK